MKEPPETLDNAKVFYWAYSGKKPFFIMSYSDGSGGIPIHGLAICQYKADSIIYRFSCDCDWEVQGDTDYDTIDEAMTAPSGQYDIMKVEWMNR